MPLRRSWLRPWLVLTDPGDLGCQFARNRESPRPVLENASLAPRRAEARRLPNVGEENGVRWHLV